MLAFVHGKLIEKALTRAVVDVNGVGYELFIPMSTYDKLPRVNEAVQLRTYLHLRQDLIQLYGFVAEEEKALFLMLITSVSGVGPKLALNILSSMPVMPESSFTHCSPITPSFSKQFHYRYGELLIEHLK